MTELIFELSQKGRKGYSLPECKIEKKYDKNIKNFIDDKKVELPEVSEQDLMRHYIKLSNLNFHVDKGMYPLGSCTMKYNPKINEDIARYKGFADVHPYSGNHDIQGILELLFDFENDLKILTGMDKFTFQPAAGAHGELTGIKIFRKYFDNKKEKRNKIIVPDSAHGTNPATASMGGFKVITISSNEKGCVDIESLKEAMDENVAGLYLTNPNTLGLFEEDILEIADIVHSNGGLLYYDGANLNATMGISRPGDMGFDIVHLNLHKTFSAPHGGGGPGSGPIGVKEHLLEYLPVPVVDKKDDFYKLNYDLKNSIGKIHGFFGNIGVVIKAYVYTKINGLKGLKRVSELACLNANYLKEQLKNDYFLKFRKTCKHEFVLSGKNQKEETGVKTLDIAKRMLDYGVHSPTVYFPLIVEEALMIEPTETESKETLDNFVEVMKKIAKESSENPEKLKYAPHTTPVKRLDEVKAMRNPNLTYKK